MLDKRPARDFHLDLGPQAPYQVAAAVVSKLVAGVTVAIGTLEIGLGIEVESARLEDARDLIAKSLARTFAQARRCDSKVDILRHSFDKPMRAAQGRPAAEHQVTAFLRDGAQGSQSSHDVEILLDETGVRQPQLGRRVSKVLGCGTTAQAAARSYRTEAYEKTARAPSPPY